MPEKKNILLIEDDANIQLLLRTALERAGYRVSAALDGIQGLMLARQSQPDLIILDMMMPAGGGESVFQRIKQMSTTLHIPILIHSAMSRDEIESKIPGLGETVVISKPASPAVMLEAVKTAFSHA